MQCIILPNGHRVSVATYVKAWRTLKTLPDQESVKGFDYFAAPAIQVLGMMRAGMDDRINQHDPAYGRGRKWSLEWQTDTMRIAHKVNHRRLLVRVRECPPEFRQRLAQRLTSEDLL